MYEQIVNKYDSNNSTNHVSSLRHADMLHNLIDSIW